jgi:hypothetical protein
LLWLDSNVLLLKALEVRKEALHSRYHLPNDAMTSASAIALKSLCKLPYGLQNLVVSC